MVIDCHYHLEERLLKTEELLQKMDTAGVAKTALMGCQVDPYPEPPSLLINLLHVLLTQGFLRSIGKLFVAQFDSAGNIKILGKSYPIYPDPDNAAVFATVEKYPDRFLGWIFVNPQGKKDQVAEFEKWKGTPGWVGVKAHCFWNHHAPIALVPVAEKLAKTGKPLLIHAGYGVEGDFMALLKEVPNLKLILAHTGFPLYYDTWKRIGHMKNVFVDLSQTSYVNEKTLRKAVEYLGVERCLFGTDGPYGFHGSDGKFDYGLIKKRIENLFPDQGVQRRLLGENFAELAGIA